MIENEIGKTIVDAAIAVHKALGVGLLEKAYQECLYYELTKRELQVEKEKELPLIYKGVKMEVAYRADLVVANKVIIELKAVEAIHPIHEAQIINYLKLSGCKLGYLLNFHSLLMKDGLRRFVNGL